MGRLEEAPRPHVARRPAAAQVLAQAEGPDWIPSERVQEERRAVREHARAPPTVALRGLRPREAVRGHVGRVLAVAPPARHVLHAQRHEARRRPQKIVGHLEGLDVRRREDHVRPARGAHDFRRARPQRSPVGRGRESRRELRPLEAEAVPGRRHAGPAARDPVVGPAAPAAPVPEEEPLPRWVVQ